MTEFHSSTGTAEASFEAMPKTLGDAITVAEMVARLEKRGAELNERAITPNGQLMLKAAFYIKVLSRAQGPLDRGVIEFEYCNWLGRKSLREARPISIRFGTSEWHPKPQWLMLAFDVHKGAEREFAMADMAFEDDALGALALSSTPSGTEPSAPAPESSQ